MAETYKVDADGYEQVDSAVISGHTIRAGAVLSCLCTYEVGNLILRWDMETKRVLVGHPAIDFNYRVRYVAECPVHSQLAKKDH